MVKSRSYVPERGDVVWLDFDPVLGHEQGGRRPALILSSREYNLVVKLAIVCPITSQVKGYPFEIEFKSKKINGAILADHVRNIDWTKRKADKIDTVSEFVMNELQEHIKKLIL